MPTIGVRLSLLLRRSGVLPWRGLVGLLLDRGLGGGALLCLLLDRGLGGGTLLCLLLGRGLSGGALLCLLLSRGLSGGAPHFMLSRLRRQRARWRRCLCYGRRQGMPGRWG